MSKKYPTAADVSQMIALDAANEIADSFSPGFFDGRMVEDVAAIIAKHNERLIESVVKDCRNIYNLIDNGNPVHGTEDYAEALYIEFLGGK